MAKLIAHTGHTFDLPEVGVTFGSDASNDVAVPAAFGVAPCHFAIWPDQQTYLVRDSGSGYGLWVNGRPIKEHALQDGDMVSAGNLQLRFVDERPAGTPRQNLPVGIAPPALPPVAASTVPERSPTLPPVSTSPPILPPSLSLPAAPPAVLPQATISLPQIPIPVAPRMATPPPMSPPLTPLMVVNAPIVLPPAPSVEAAMVVPVAVESGPSENGPAQMRAAPAQRIPANHRPAASGPMPAKQNLHRPPPAPVHGGPATAAKSPFAELSGSSGTPGTPAPTESAPVVTNARFEIVLGPGNLEEESAPTQAITVASPAAAAPPSWIPSEAKNGGANAAPVPPQFDEGVVKRRRDGHRKPSKFMSIMLGSFALLLIAGTVTARYWCKPLADFLTTVGQAIFSSEDPFEKPKPPAEVVTAQPYAENVGKEEARVRVEDSKSHLDVAPRFVWPEATTLFSLGFPEIEIFYVNAAHRKGLPLPRPHCAFLEKHFGLQVEDLQRLTSIQQDPDVPSVVVFTTNKPIDPVQLLTNSNLSQQAPENVGAQEILHFTSKRGKPCGMVVIDDRNFVVGDSGLIAQGLKRNAASMAANLSGLWPEFLRKTPGAFLWTVKQDAELQQQLRATAGAENLPLDSVQSFAVRFAQAPAGCQCFAVRSEKASQEAFTTAANACLNSMLKMITSQVEARSTRGTIGADQPAIDVSRSVATAEMRRGDEFVNLFLESFYAPPATEISPLDLLTKARTLAHSFNLARGLGAAEAQSVRSVEDALTALQSGMSGTGKASGMEFQVQTMEPEEVRLLRNYLTFADGYLACRPNMDSVPDTARPLIEEARDRLNAETVLSLIPAPSSDRVIKLKDLGMYIRQNLTRIKTGRGAMALFGLPQLTDEELDGVLRYVHQDARGSLAWKPNEMSFTQWQAKSNPSALRDAATLVSIFNAAKAAGVDNFESIKSVEEAIGILTRGVKGSGQFATTVFRCDNLSDSEFKAAANLLTLEKGSLRLKDR